MLKEKVISSFPVSIGTSLALESIWEGRLPPYDPSREIPQKIDINNYQELWLNGYTMTRNLMRALSLKIPSKYSPHALAVEVYSEVDHIVYVASHESPHLKIVTYWPDYTSEMKALENKKVKVRMPHTPLQLQTHQLEELIRKAYKKILKSHNIELATKISNPATPKLVLTHVNLDLVNANMHRKLDLLESHTGRLVTPELMNKRYFPVPGYDMSHLPFNKPLLIAFGDRSMFKPHSVSARKEVMDVSIKAKWTPMTRESRVKSDLKRYMKDKSFSEWLMTF